jgi:hypothetical protein
VYQKKEFDESNRWSLFPEENKKSDNGPDYTGEVDIGGTKYRLAGWKRVSKKSGKKFLSGAIEPKDGKNDKQTNTKSAAPFDDPFEI